MNQMNMAGGNPNTGGPVGGFPMTNNGSSAPRNDLNSLNDTMVVQLNTYIYDYFLKKGYHDCARALAKDESVPLNTTPQTKQSRRDGEVNGVDGDTMMSDSKDDTKSKIPDDLPRPSLNGDPQQTSFLFDWWNLFWDIFSAQRKKGRSTDAVQYLQHTQSMLRMRDQHQNQMMRQSMLQNGQFPMRGMRPAMMQQNLPKNVMQNPQNMTPQQLAQLQKNQAIMQQQMHREQSEMEMNGHRPQSPSSVENAPSPSKRPRLDASQVNGQQMTPNGRAPGQPMPGQPQQTNSLLMQHGINPRNLTPQQFQALQQTGPHQQQKSLQIYNQSMAMQQRSNLNQGMPNGLMNPGVMPNQDMMQMHEGQGMLPMQDYYGANGQMAQMRPGMGPNGAGPPGSHALQDYQMQLMLLEQQNKRRLLMARQEQDNISRTEGGQPGPGMSSQPNLPPGTSPQGSRTGASPNPNEQMKRGTPKMPPSGLPGSPNVGDPMAGRGSPASMNFGGQMPADMNGAFFNMKAMPEGVVAPNGMRPPSSNPAYSGPQAPQAMDAMARAQQGQPGGPNRIPSGGWQQGPQGQHMIPPQQQGQPQPVGTPQERNTMPPPQAPSAAGGNATGRTQTSSPQSGAPAPPTPQQASKPAPKSKKEGTEKGRKRPTKKGAAANAAATAAATPSSEAERPPTPTPTTPITPGHPTSFHKNGTSNAQQPTSAPAPQPLGPPQPHQQPPQPHQQPPQQPLQDPSHTFADMGLPDQNYNLDFSTLDNPDILENFDFDSFLNTDDASGFTYDPGMTFPDGVETGAGEGL